LKSDNENGGKMFVRIKHNEDYMTRRKQKRTPKKSSASKPSRVTYYYRTKFVAYGDLLGRNCRLPVKVALPADDWCMGLFQVTPLSAFGERVFRQDLSRLDVVELYIAGRNVNALVASKGDNSGKIWIYADEVLHGLGYRVSVEEDRLYGDRRKGDAKLKKAQRNG
jgi:hypothetical protein